jgi:hypothetical protein
VFLSGALLFDIGQFPGRFFLHPKLQGRLNKCARATFYAGWSLICTEALKSKHNRLTVLKKILLLRSRLAILGQRLIYGGIQS